MHFNISYSSIFFQETELLRVRLLRGTKLGKRDLFGVCSPYCLVRLENSNGDIVDEVQVETKRKVRF